MEILQQRVRLHHQRTASDLSIDGRPFCHVVEDPVREIPGRPVAEWKQHGRTAIPAGRYRCTLETSPRFGPGTISLHDVPGFAGVRVHGGNDEDDTEGCPLVGYQLTPTDTIVGGTSRPALVALKAEIRTALEAGEAVWWTVANPEGYAGPA